MDVGLVHWDSAHLSMSYTVGLKYLTSFLFFFFQEKGIWKDHTVDRENPGL